MIEEREGQLRAERQRLQGLIDQPRSRIAWGSRAFIDVYDDRDRLRAELAAVTEVVECGMCGGPMSRNPDPDAGKPDKLSDVGAMWECIPCAVRGRSKAYWRAVKAEGELAAVTAERDRLLDFSGLSAELAAMAAERDRMRVALERIDTPAVSTCEYVYCAGDAEGREHEENCIYRIAYDALNPEPQA